jgi:hypothetical protein
VLLKYKPLVAFLRANHLETYVELTTYYAELMEQVYYKHLRGYFKDTAKLIQKAPRSTDFITEAEEDPLTTQVQEQERDRVTRRALILENLTAQPIVMAISQQK